MNQLYADYIRGLHEPAFDGLLESLSTTAPVVAVRYNAQKQCRPPMGADIVAWCPQGEYLKERPQFILDPRLHQGLYYVQDASSMVISRVVGHLTRDAQRPLAVLDACAAPGGKTTAAIDALPAGSVMVANEYSPQRVGALRENLAKWGYPLTTVLQGDTARFRSQGPVFDLILADVPCSGEGMMRKDQEAVDQWTPQLPVSCAGRQREIVANLWEALRPGGYLVYSTCTFNRLENEEILDYIISELGAESVELPLVPEWGIQPGIDTPHYCYRFMPHRLRGEGLFVAAVRKPLEEGKEAYRPYKAYKPNKSNKALKGLDLDSLSIDPRWGCSFELDGERLFAVPAIEVALPEEWHPRVEMATVKGRSLVPSPQLAYSLLLNPEGMARVEVGLDDALAFLRRQAMTLPGDAPRGVVLLTYGERPLGFVKNLGSRANNLYHPSWRILR
ncbi:MAG: hypothetical protein LIO90_00445 [Bacteroidales bacterium]|nr:hypothetical protein [Bacteroidales bacterium]